MMHAQFRKIGAWTTCARLAVNLTHELNRAKNISLKRWGLKAEAIVKGHLSSQDWAGSKWAPLAPATLQIKSRKGFSLNTLIASSTYFQSISSWVAPSMGKYGGIVYVGVPEGKAYYKKGTSKTLSVAEAAAVQEYGSMVNNIPARPLWEPSGKEVMDWHLKFNKPGDVFIEIIRLKYPVGSII